MLNNSPCPYHLVQSCFTYLATSDFHENNIRVKPDLDALGALGDVGWYCIRAILFAVDYELPKSVKALPGTVFNEAGVQDFVIPVKEDSAAFSAGIESWFNDLVTGWKTMPSEHVVTTDLPQEALMVKEFSGLVADIKRNGSKLEQKWPTLSRKTQLVLDAVKVSIERGLEPVEL
ncbi:putative oxidoreductase [Vitis vinifera]|uniref:Putative oxidoreductase n=1 Tax=Vitis vinifera TaxID=29760 RepID=A0A438GGI2_VITVI|nr:putative oxidoreductase [Vitis vinifera]